MRSLGITVRAALTATLVSLATSAFAQEEPPPGPAGVEAGVQGDSGAQGEAGIEVGPGPQPAPTPHAPAPPPHAPVAPPHAPAPPPPPAPALTGEARARHEDANIDRAWITPTAMTQPAGSLSFSSYELFFMGLSYGITDDVQITGTTLVPLTTDFPFLLISNLKARVVNAGNVHVTLQGTLTLMNSEVFGDNGDRETNAALNGAGIVSLCLDPDCGSILSGSLYTGYLFDVDQSDAPLFAAGSGLFRVGRHVKLMVELASGATLQEGFVPGAMLNYGVRFHGTNFAGDIGFLNAIYEDEGGLAIGIDPLVFGIPFVAFTYRAF